MKAKRKIVPELRFPRFNGGWSEAILGDALISLDAGVSVNSEDIPVRDGELGVLKTSCVTEGYFDSRENKRVLEPSEQSRLREPVSANSIIISRMNTPALVGLSGLVTKNEQNLFLPDRLWAAKISSDHSPRWVSHLLTSPKIRGMLSDRASGTSNSMKNITKGDVFTLPVSLPPLPEQRKIADFLTAVDRRIQQLSQKKALLEAYKRGVMQQLFTQTLRFKDDEGNDFPDWEETTLGDLLTFKNGFNAEKGQYGKGVKFINVLDVLSSSPITHDSIIGRVEIPAKDFPKFEVKYGDLLFQRSSETREEVGQANVYLDKGQTAAFGGFVIRGQPKAKFDRPFMNYLLRTPLARNEITTKSGGSTRYNVSQDTLAEARVVMPSSIPEQTKIANFLTALNGKIEAVSTQLTHTQTFKKGLLQQMFV